MFNFHNNAAPLNRCAVYVIIVQTFFCFLFCFVFFFFTVYRRCCRGTTDTILIMICGSGCDCIFNKSRAEL